MAQNANTDFPGSLYLPFRPFADRAGLECLDSHCDLWTDFGKPDAYQHSVNELDINIGNAGNPTQPLVGFKVLRGCDRFRLTMARLRSGVGNLGAPVPFKLQVKLGQAGCGEDAQFDKTITVPAYNRTGLLTQISGLLFDTVQIWAGNDFEIAGTNTQRMMIRVLVDRMGHGTRSTVGGLDEVTVLDGPFK